MIDREKVLNALRCHANCDRGFDCGDCAYIGNGDCLDLLAMDAYALLKEQETELEHLWDAPDRTYKGRCKKCGFVHFFIEGHNKQYKFCPECGRSVKLDDI